MSARYSHFIGVDPGPIPGIVHLWPYPGRLEVDVVQCSDQTAPGLLWSLIVNARADLRSRFDAPVLIQIERFVVGSRTARSSTQSASSRTRDLVHRLTSESEKQPNVSVVLRSASEVKPWATDERLAAVGLLEAVKGMRHAKDAARHALFAAVKAGALPDPLSRSAHN